MTNREEMEDKLADLTELMCYPHPAPLVVKKYKEILEKVQDLRRKEIKNER